MPVNIPIPGDWYPLAEVAALLDRTPQTIRYHAAKHGLGVAFGNGRIFSEGEVETLRTCTLTAPGRKRQEET